MIHPANIRSLGSSQTRSKVGTACACVALLILVMAIAFSRDSEADDPKMQPVPAQAKQPTPPQVCEKCGQLIATNQSKTHKCDSAPLSPQELERRKAEAHALSRGQDDEFRIRASSSESSPKEMAEFIRNQSAAIALGKALFWDMRVGSDDRTACATCHHHAGIDTRTKNTAFTFIDVNMPALHKKQWTSADHKPWKDDGGKDSRTFGLITGDSSVVIGSQGVRPLTFDADDFERQVKANSERIVERGNLRPGVNESFRQVTSRNSPTAINSSLLARLFHDGRASDLFNGYDVFGPDSPYEDTLGKYRVRNGRIERVTIEIPHAAAASQAMGPPVNDVEMSYKGRDFSHIAMKLLESAPLVIQDVHSSDSALGMYVTVPTGEVTAKGLNTTYRKLIQEAFHETWWNQGGLPLSIPRTIRTDKQKQDFYSLEPKDPINDMMVANFSLYFGLAILAYEQTLDSDQTPFDRFMQEGEVRALSPQARLGLDRFVNHGCADCHLMPEFAGSTNMAIFGEGKEEEVDEYEEELASPKPLPKPLNPDGNAFVEEMLFKIPEFRFRAYDNGFYNIGVTGLIETKFDYGVGHDPDFFLEKSRPKTRTSLPSVDANYDPDGLKVLKQNFMQRAIRELPQNEPQDNLDRPADSDQKSEYHISRARRLFPNQNPRKDGQSAVNGAFKTPSLRNVAMTAPYMHNGAFLTLQEVMRFYRYGPREITGDTRGKNFHHPELVDLRESLSNDPDDDAILAFLHALSDPRVARHAAPFDHPSLVLPSGNKENATGQGNELDETFELPTIGRESTPEQLNTIQSLPTWSKIEQ